VLKTSIDESVKHSCIEYCVEKREKFSKTECFIIVVSLLMAIYTHAINTAFECLKTGIVAVFLFLMILRFIYKVHSESLVIIAPIGLQLTTTYINGRQKVFSLPWQSITDILIVDVIHTQKVLYYLAIKTTQNGLVTLFQKSAPRLNFLEIIYRDIFKLMEIHR
jgi:hypothetical protein